MTRLLPPSQQYQQSHRIIPRRRRRIYLLAFRSGSNDSAAATPQNRSGYIGGIAVIAVAIRKLSYIILLMFVVVEVAASNRRTSFYSNKNNHPASLAQTYDRSVTTFDPNGRLLQVQYAQYAATQRTKRTVVAMMDTVHDTIYIATTSTATKSSGSEQNQPQPHQFLYRITRNIYFIGIGFMGDIRAMASHLRVQAQQHIYHYQEDMTVYEMAKIMCQLHHQCTYQSGIRPLGISCLIFGIDNAFGSVPDGTGFDCDRATSTHSRGWKMFKCTPGGSIPENCNDVGCAVVGYKEDALLQELYQDHDENVNITDTNTTNYNGIEADHLEQFISSLKNAFHKIDDHDNEISRMMDVYAFRGSSVHATHHHRPQHPSAITCFANIDCGTTNNNNDQAYQNSLMRVRQYYNEQ
jgi:20S proteasome alpha/beta subunit